MEELIGRLRSPSTSLSSSAPAVNSNFAAGDLLAPEPSAAKPQMSRLEALPAEIITHILAFLPAVSLAGLSRTSHLLRSHAHNDLLWMHFVKMNIPNNAEVASPSPAKSWRDLYIAHHPYWFLVRHKIWFSDLPDTGTIILARYNHQQGCIEAYRLIADHGAHTFDLWQHNPDVIIHTFNPKVRLFLEDPIIMMEYEGSIPYNRLQTEVAMPTRSAHGVRSLISLCQPISKHLQDPSMALWPPFIIPAAQRVRNQSSNKFRDEAHRPRTSDRMSDQTFRLRKWVEWPNLMQPLTSIRMGEDVMTYSTLLQESYIPTKEKPWQGIWCGDYSGHGCEFLLVMQREVSTNTTMSRQSSTGSLPPGMSMEEMEVEGHEDRDAGFHQIAEEALEGSSSESQAMHNGTHEIHMGDIIETNAQLAESSVIDHEAVEFVVSRSHMQFPSHGQDAHGASKDNWKFGRLEAIKLTGDINVPRGQYTWIAEDIGPKGLLRVGNEQMFAGARIVKSWGRIAGRGFRHDRFISSQLIIISHDTLAQYWEDFGHISFYTRVNIDDYLNI